jgi:hypothetical protein
VRQGNDRRNAALTLPGFAALGPLSISGLYICIHEHFEAIINAASRRLKLFQSMKLGVAFVEDQVFHPSIRQFLTGLTEQNHQHNPFHLLYINITGTQGH